MTRHGKASTRKTWGAGRAGPAGSVSDCSGRILLLNCLLHGEAYAMTRWEACPRLCFVSDCSQGRILLLKSSTRRGSLRTNAAYDAKKRGIPDALNLLLTGDGKGAAEVLRKGGIKLLDDPVRNNSDDPLSNSWRFRFEDGREKDINVRAIATKVFSRPLSRY